MKSFALSLAFITRFTETRKYPIGRRQPLLTGQAVPVVWPSGLSDRSSSDSAAELSPLSTTTTGAGDAARVLLLERLLPTRLSSFVWILKLIRPQVTSCKVEFK